MPSGFGLRGGLGRVSGGFTIGPAVGLMGNQANEKRKPIRWIIKGITKDYLGVALPSCVVDAYLSKKTSIVQGQSRGGNPSSFPDGFPTGRYVNGTTSDDTTGAYRIEVPSVPGDLFQLQAYKTGSPDRAGITVNTLAANLETDQ